MRKVFYTLHLWLSVPFGVLITLICFTGAMLVFETEITEKVYPNRFFVEQTATQPLSVDQILTNVAATLPADVSITGVNVSGNSNRAYQVLLSKPRKASLYVNQYTGQVIEYSKQIAFFSYMFRTHRWLLDTVVPDKTSVGKTVVGISTIVFVFIIISGLFIWIPRSRKGLKNRLSIHTSKGLRRFWYDLHVSAGFYTSLILLSLALTGLTWSFPWYREGFNKVFGVTMQPAANAHQQPEKSRKEGKREVTASPFLHWQQVLDALREQNPEYKNIGLSKGSANVSFEGYGNQRAADKYTFDNRSGDITSGVKYADLPKSDKIRGWIYSVHVGSYGGWFTRLLVFFVALIGASLPITGYYLWIKKTFNKRARK